MLQSIIRRPVLATVISVLLVLLGIVGLTRLPITQFPDIAPPTIFVSGVYPGGNSEAVIRSVITPLEESINGVENMDYMKSSASNDGSFSVSIVFKQGTDPDQAAVNVQNRVAQINSQMPPEVLQAGISTSKQQNSNVMYFNVYSEDRTKYDEKFLQNYIKINLVPELKRIQGVGQVQMFGSKDYSMRVWLNPQKMAANNLTPKEVTEAISDQSLETAPGKFGEESKEAIEYVVKYKGKLNLPEQYEDLIIKSTADGGVLRLKDVARIEFGAASYSSDTKMDGMDAVTLGILQASGSNANEIEIAVRKSLIKAAKDFPKGINYEIIQSTKERLDESISQVKTTLIEAFILVFIVVFIFLQDFRSTLIPAIAVPVAIIGTFFFLQLIGFTVNVLTLFALVLAIGIVVDDAIVVVEAVHAKMEGSDLTAREATYSAMSEITGAIVSITLVMAAVFLPIGFMEGSSGIFYKQFAFTLAIAILISAVNALTLSPALCALFLKNPHAEKEGKKTGFSQRFFQAFNTSFDRMTAKYIGSLKWLIRFKWVSLGGLALVTGITLWMLNTTPKGFVPMEDDSFMIYSLTMPSGTGLDRTTKFIKKVDSTFKSFESVKTTTSVSGFNIMSNSASPAYGLGFVKLKAPKERGEVQDMDAVLGMVNAKMATLKEGTVSVFRMPPVAGYGAIGGVEFVLQDRTGGDLQKFSQVANKIVGELFAVDGVAVAFTTFKADYPQFELEVNDQKAKQLGVSVRDLLSTIQVYYGGSQASDFNRFGKYYRVNVKADGIYRTDKESLNMVFVKNAKGDMVPASELVSVRKVYGPESVDRYNLFNSITINAIAKPGVSNGKIMDEVEKLLAEKLPNGYSYEWNGLSREEKSSGSQTVFILALSLLFVYFLLAAQYESYILPLAVMLSIPTGLLGVFIAIKIAGIDNNIYVQIGLIMLIGLLAKNAILIIEFALQRRKEGMDLIPAALEGSRLRLRPILMTSLAFIAGMIPLMIATGGSAMGNRSISTGAAGGMLAGVILGLFIIPVLFVVFQSLQEKITGKPGIETDPQVKSH